MSKDLLKYIMKRLGMTILTLWIIITVTFILMHAVPSSPFMKEKAVSAATMEALKRRYGLDKSYIEQYFIYLGNAIKFDFGESIKYQDRLVIDIISNGFATSAFLGITAGLIAIIFGIVFGCIAAVNRGKFIDQLILVLTTASVSLPSFVIGVILMWVFSYYIPIFPSNAKSILDFGTEGFEISGYVLPIISLALYPSSYITRLVRSSMLDALGQDYIRTAKAKGVSKFNIVFKHTLRNSLAPVISYSGPMIAYIMAGSFVVEKVFSIPGVGSDFVNSITTLDYTMIMGTTILLAVLMLTMNFISDILYKVIDPRVELS